MNVVDFGVFVEVRPGIDGLVYVSNLLPGEIKDEVKPQSVVSKGDELRVRIVDIDQKNRRIELALVDPLTLVKKSEPL